VTASRRSGVGAPSGPVRPDVRELPVDALVSQAIDVALENLSRLEREAREVAKAFRANARDEARGALQDLVHATQAMATLATVSAQAMGTDLAAFCDARGLHPEADTNAAVSALIWQQRAGDRQAVASTLERPFTAALGAWRALFAGLGGEPTGPGGHAA
jgi:hypothetical protein